MGKKIILDCDPGYDDAVALFLAHGHPDIELLAVTTVVGNQTLEKVTRNALSVARIIKMENVTFAAGCTQPLVKPIHTAAEIHGESGLDGPVLPEPHLRLSLRHAVDVIIETILSQPKDSVTLVPTGGLTNIAMALRKEPKIIDRVREVVLMGGAIRGGNATPCAEFNIYIDPEAAEIVFNAGWKVTMIGLDVTHKALATLPIRNQIRQIDTGPARFLSDLLGFFSEKYQKVHGFDAPAIHDPCAVAYVINPDLFTVQQAPISIETQGKHTTGMTVVDLRHRPPATCQTYVATDINSEAFWALIVEAMQHIGEGDAEACKIY
ncbi:Nucleoside hydrolase [Paramixta manurensis]|uniref:Nucleoside hydrolase n=1 Tax=Paramixta manurensis TaxID=2740817 RepID=A0A6M8URH3_9GAMM|nr:Nucleoside hydrolase [Erwiniaceae bacterium PD-1]